MKLWKSLVILLCVLIGGVSYAGFWSNDPGIGPGTRLPPGLIIPNPIISDPQLTGLITLVPGSTLWVQGNVIYEPYSIITGPDGSTWNVFGITNLANLTMSTSGVLTFPDGSYWDNGGLDTSSNTVLNINGTSKVNFNNTTTLNFATGTTINGPDGSVWNVNGIQNLKSLSVVNNVSVGGNQTIGGSLTVNGPTILNGATTVINNFTADGTTTLNGPTNINNNLNVSGNTTLNNLTVTGNLTLPPGATATFPTLTVTQTFNAPDGSTWTSAGLNLNTGLNFHGVPMGGNCPATEYMAGLTSTGVISCSTPAGTGGGGSTLPTPTGPFQTLQTAANNSVVWNNTIGAGIAPNPAFPLVVGTGGTTLYQFSSTALNFSAGVGITFNGTPPGGACPANQFMVALSTSLIPTCAPGGVVTSSTPPASPIPGVLWFDPVSVQLFIWYKQNGQMQWVPVINQPNSAVGGIGTGGGITQLSAGQGITLSPSPINNGASGTVSLSTSPVTPGSYTNANITVNSLGIITAASSGTGGGGSVSITASNSGVTVSPSPLTGTGTIGLSIAPTSCTGGQFVSAISVLGVGTCTSPTGGGSVSITAGNSAITVSPSPLTGTGTIALSLTPTACTGNQFVSAISAIGVGTCTSPTGGGGGTVTSITAGTGLTGGTITTSGTIALATSGVTGGSYTNANITVNAQGIVTAASNGTGGGGLPTATAPFLTLQSNASNNPVWNANIGIGQAPGSDPIDITDNVAGNANVSLVNSNAGTLATSQFSMGNGSHNGNFGFTGTGYSAGVIGPNAFYMYTDGAGGIVFYNAGTGSTRYVNGANAIYAQFLNGLQVGTSVTGGDMGIGTINVSGGFYINGVAVGGSGPTLPLSTANGGLGQAVTPVNGQILVGQTAGWFNSVLMSGDATLGLTGALTVTKTSGHVFTSASYTAIGTSGATIPLLSTANTWTLAQTFSVAPVMSGASITAATIPMAALANSGVTAGSYTSANITVNAQGLVTVAANGSGGGAPLVNPTNGQNNYAPLASPHFTGTVTLPDASTMDVNGHNNSAGIGIGIVSPGAGMQIYQSAANPTWIALEITQGGPTGWSNTRIDNNISFTDMGVTGGSYATVNGLGPDTFYFKNSGVAGGMQFRNSAAAAPFSFWANNVQSASIAPDPNYPMLSLGGTTIAPKANVQASTVTAILQAGQHLNSSGTEIADNTNSAAVSVQGGGTITFTVNTTNTVGSAVTNTPYLMIGTFIPTYRFNLIATGTAGTAGGTGGGAACFTSSQGLISNNANCIASSLSLKKDIRPLDGGLATIERLAPAAIYYRYKQGDPSEQPGFGAETVAQIDPRYVTFQNGKPAGIRYEQMTATEAVAIKEQQQEIEQLKAEINALRARLR